MFVVRYQTNAHSICLAFTRSRVFTCRLCGSSRSTYAFLVVTFAEDESQSAFVITVSQNIGSNSRELRFQECHSVQNLVFALFSDCVV